MPVPSMRRGSAKIGRVGDELSTPTGVTAATLLEPLTDNQQRMIELIAVAFIENAWEWPVFDYVEGHLDGEGIEEWTELARLPQQAGSGYSAASWDRAGNAAPRPDTPVGLTVLGLHHAEARAQVSAGFVPMFLSLVRFLAVWRRQRPLGGRPTQRQEHVWGTRFRSRGQGSARARAALTPAMDERGA